MGCHRCKMTGHTQNLGTKIKHTEYCQDGWNTGSNHMLLGLCTD